MEGPGREDVESWKRNPWSKLPTWGKWAVGVVGGVLLLGVGAAIGASGEAGVEDERDEIQLELTESERERERAGSILARRDAIIAQAKDQATRIVGKARSEQSQLTEKLGDLRDEIGSTEGELANVESSLEGAEEAKAKSTIPGDGTFRADVDYIPGTYQSSGGAGCYWATLNSADPFDIASNENATGQTIASISTPYFQTEGCGTWERVGD